MKNKDFSSRCLATLAYQEDTWRYIGDHYKENPMTYLAIFAIKKCRHGLTREFNTIENKQSWQQTCKEYEKMKFRINKKSQSLNYKLFKEYIEEIAKNITEEIEKDLRKL